MTAKPDPAAVLRMLSPGDRHALGIVMGQAIQQGSASPETIANRVEMILTVREGRQGQRVRDAQRAQQARRLLAVVTAHPGEMVALASWALSQLKQADATTPA